MLKVAILGYGRQGVKHASIWRSFGVSPEIFTKSGREGTRKISEFIPTDYSIIICAIFPIEEQTKVIHQILDQGYSHYLIIEKPISYSETCLIRLKNRKKTIFFIDEVFLPQQNDKKLPEIIEISSRETGDNFALIEHAIGWFLYFNKGSFNFLDISFRQTEIGDYTYAISFRNNKEVFRVNIRNLIFFSVYQGLMYKLQDDSFHANIRNNYYSFRQHQELKNYLTP